MTGFERGFAGWVAPMRLWLCALTLAGTCGATACDGASSRVVDANWSEVLSGALSPASGSVPVEATVRAGGPGDPWIIGGVILIPDQAENNIFRPQDSRTVALWTAPSRSGPWQLASMNADPQRDGPNETIMFVTGAAAGRSGVAFGWRNSPTEGYPRPSAWISESPSGQSWIEIVEPREFFGGPNIVGFGGLSGGPHGFFICGTWTDPAGRPVISVWHSSDGRSWSQDTADPAFAGRAGETPFGKGVADSDYGVLLVGTAEVPTPSDPTGQRGEIWYSKSGQSWRRLFTGELAADASTAFASVAAIPAGWLVAGTRMTRHGVREESAAAVWLVSNNLKLRAEEYLPTGSVGDPIAVTSMSVDASHVLVGGVAGGKPILWTASIRNGVVRSWRPLAAPSVSISNVQTTIVSISETGAILGVANRTATQVWTTGWH
jgi:hypothetical protein